MHPTFCPLPSQARVCGLCIVSRGPLTPVGARSSSAARIRLLVPSEASLASSHHESSRLLGRFSVLKPPSLPHSRRPPSLRLFAALPVHRTPPRKALVDCVSALSYCSTWPVRIAQEVFLRFISLDGNVTPAVEAIKVSHRHTFLAELFISPSSPVS